MGSTSMPVCVLRVSTGLVSVWVEASMRVLGVRVEGGDGDGGGGGDGGGDGGGGGGGGGDGDFAVGIGDEAGVMSS